MNFQILIKIAALIQDINLSSSETNHFFGDLFEGLDKENHLLTDLSAQEIDGLFADGTISGGMLPKIGSALDAAKSGVNSVHIIDGRIEHSLLLEVLTDQPFGTMIRSH